MKKTIGIAPLIVLASCGVVKSTSISSSQDTGRVNVLDSSSDILVACFSVTNHTWPLAEYAQKHYSCDLFEIVPTVPYTDEDINYNDNQSRANKEQNDPTARPKIKNAIPNFDKYQTVFLGYPIWWGEAPKIIYTFVEAYDFEGVTVIPFCTSGSSDIGSSATHLSQSAPKATWKQGKRFSIGTSESSFASWLDEVLPQEEKGMNLKIDGTAVPMNWLDNASVDALKDISPLEIHATRYGGFEQVGPIGQSIVSSDARMVTEPGDVVLYASNQIVVFFGSNTWEYTKLGHIDLSKDELTALLNKEAVTITIA